MNPFHRAAYLTGPTASGKTSVGVALADRLGAEIIAMDSMTLYRGMDIGTAKPTIEERQGILHHLIDVIDPWEAASVAEYRNWARAAIEAIEAKGRKALFVGGTPLYLKALLRGLFEGPGADPDYRRKLEEVADSQGVPTLHDRLARLDPAKAQRLHPNDRRRIVRALEVMELTGQPLSALQAEHDRPAPTTVPVYAIQRPRPELVDRINRRVIAMIDAGWIEEVRALLAGPRPWHPVPSQGVGYRELLEYVQGRGLSLAETIDRIQAKTRQFSKRQGTWFRGFVEVQPWPVGAEESAQTIADRLASAIEARSPR